MAGKLRLKGAALLRLGAGAENMHQLAMKSKVSYMTVNKYVSRPEEIKFLDLDVLPNVLIDGLGVSPADLMKMRVGDLFEYVPQ